MSIWCDSCRSCHPSSPCTHLHSREEDPRRAACRRFRSTKRASKARRDHINHEIRNMRALLPISQEDKERLSYLHSMAAICTYVRKSVLFQGLQTPAGSASSVPYGAFLEALQGFLLVCTARGRLVYVSENVAEYLGLSMVDVLQGDGLYELVDRSDLDVVRRNLDVRNNPSAERSFVCRMQTSRAFRLQQGSCCSVLVRGSFQFFPPASSAASRTPEPLFVALCAPTADRLAGGSSGLGQSFSSEHGPDMSFTRTSDSVFFLLGRPAAEMTGRSWYDLLHPEDLLPAAAAHRTLVQAERGFQVEMVLRLHGSDLSWTWFYIRATNDGEHQSISCTNFLISEPEARFLQKKISSKAFKPPSGSHDPNFDQQASPSQTDGAKDCKRLRTSNSCSEESGGGTGRKSELDFYCVLCTASQGDGFPAPLGGSPDLFTPPYSPASSGSPLQQEELLVDVQEHVSSPDASPFSYFYPAVGLTCQRSPAAPAPRTTGQTFTDPTPSLPLDYDFPTCSSDARLVPDGLFVSDTCEIPAECSSLHLEDFDLLEQPQGGGSVQLQHVPQQELPTRSNLLTPLPSPTPTSHYSEREREEISVLAQQISSLASSFDLHRSLNLFQHVAQTAAGDWPHDPEPLGEHASVFESVLTDLSAGKPGLSHPGSVPYSQQSEQEALDLFDKDFCPGGINVDPFSLQLGHQNLNSGLHQLLSDGLAEQTLY